MCEGKKQKHIPGLIIFGALRAVLLHQAPVGQQIQRIFSNKYTNLIKEK